jgi:hypothetical protein
MRHRKRRDQNVGHLPMQEVPHQVHFFARGHTVQAWRIAAVRCAGLSAWPNAQPASHRRLSPKVHLGP